MAHPRPNDPRIACFDEAEVQLSEQDSLFVLDLLDNPPPPTPRLVAAARTRLEHA